MIAFAQASARLADVTEAGPPAEMMMEHDLATGFRARGDIRSCRGRQVELHHVALSLRLTAGARVRGRQVPDDFLDVHDFLGGADGRPGVAYRHPGRRVDYYGSRRYQRTRVPDDPEQVIYGLLQARDLTAIPARHEADAGNARRYRMLDLGEDASPEHAAPRINPTRTARRAAAVRPGDSPLPAWTGIKRRDQISSRPRVSAPSVPHTR